MQTYVIPDTHLFVNDGSPDDYPLLVRDMPKDDRPREKLTAEGPEVLTLQELLAIVLLTGTTKEDVGEMSRRLIKEYGEKSIMSERNPERLARELDIPLVKACQIVAVGELGRRYYDRSQSGFPVIRNAKDVYDYLSDMRNLSKEHIRCLYLNSHNRIIRDELVSMGTVSANLVHPREVFQPAIECKAVAIVMAHNHPSGEVTPSDDDVKITRQLVQAGKILGIRLLDHVIITKDAFASVEANLE